MYLHTIYDVDFESIQIDIETNYTSANDQIYRTPYMLLSTIFVNDVNFFNICHYFFCSLSLFFLYLHYFMLYIIGNR